MANIRLVIFDWGGTAIDHGCMAPVTAFVRTFAEHEVNITTEEARSAMGLHKKDHIRALLQNAGIGERWRKAHSRDWTEADVEDLYQRFIPLQLEVLDDHNDLCPGLIECVAELRSRGIRIGSTTGYFREAATRVLASARLQGYLPDCNMCPDDVRWGRPAPWMIFRIMEQLQVYPPSAVVKVGDTVPDIEEGLNAGVFSVGVLRTSNEVGCSEREWERLSASERRSKLEAARAKLISAGAHAVIETLDELPALLNRLGRSSA